MSNILIKDGKVVGGLPITIENMTLLWENPDPTSAFAAQNIELSSGDYDFLLFVVRATSGANRQVSEIISKGSGIIMSYTVDRNVRSRLAEYTNDTKYAVADAISSTIGGPTSETNNLACIPYKIYGIKKNGIANNVSTKASDCYLNNGKSVEEVIGGGSVSVTADGVKTYSQLLNELNALIDFSKVNRNTCLTDSTNKTVAYIGYKDSNRLDFVAQIANHRYSYSARTSSSQASTYAYTTSTYTDISSTVPVSGTIIAVEY